MTENAKGFPSRKRPARTPPSTFLFLPIHLSNSPEPCSPVENPANAEATQQETEARTFDAATRTWPREHGRMLGHRVNSEGLRRRAIAPSGGAPKTPYIGFDNRYCQPFGREKKGCGGIRKRQFPSGFRCGRQDVAAASFASRCLSEFIRPRPFAPHCGHIPPSFFVVVVGDVAVGG